MSPLFVLVTILKIPILHSRGVFKMMAFPIVMCVPHHKPHLACPPNKINKKCNYKILPSYSFKFSHTSTCRKQILPVTSPLMFDTPQQWWYMPLWKFNLPAFPSLSHSLPPSHKHAFPKRPWCSPGALTGIPSSYGQVYSWIDNRNQGTWYHSKLCNTTGACKISLNDATLNVPTDDCYLQNSPFIPPATVYLSYYNVIISRTHEVVLYEVLENFFLDKC